MRILYLQKDPFVNAGVTQLVACTNEAGHESHLMIENAEGDLRRAIRRIDPDVIGFSVTTGLHLWALQLAHRVKRWFPEIKTIFGGMHATFYPEMIEGDVVDVVCRGDGEDALVEYLDALDAGADSLTGAVRRALPGATSGPVFGALAGGYRVLLAELVQRSRLQWIQAAVRTLSRSRGTTALPSRSIRSVASRRWRRGTSGAGYCRNRS